MQKIFLYVSLILIYLGLAKALSPTEVGVNYLPNEKGFAKILPGKQVTAILTDMHATGFIIKTYYQKYRVIYGFQHLEEIIVRTSRDFALKNSKHIGMSLYRRLDGKESTIPMPPGTNFIGQREFGEWKAIKDQEVWSFYRAYKNLPKYFGWGEFKPDREFYQAFSIALEQKKPFFGNKNQFGESGSITIANFPHFFKEKNKEKKSFKTLLLDYLKENF